MDVTFFILAPFDVLPWQAFKTRRLLTQSSFKKKQNFKNLNLNRQRQSISSVHDQQTFVKGGILLRDNQSSLNITYVALLAPIQRRTDCTLKKMSPKLTLKLVFIENAGLSKKTFVRTFYQEWSRFLLVYCTILRIIVSITQMRRGCELGGINPELK